MGAVFYFCDGCGQRFDVNMDRPTAPSRVKAPDGRDLWVLRVEDVEVHRCDVTNGGRHLVSSTFNRRTG